AAAPGAARRRRRADQGVAQRGTRTCRPGAAGRHAGGRGVRAVLFSAVFAMVCSLVGTPLIIRLLVRRGYGQLIRDDGPISHQPKRGPPTMGGPVILLAPLIGYFAAKGVTLKTPSASALLVLFLMTGLGVVGFVDDFIKIYKQRSLGLRARAKLIGQSE